MKKLFLLIIFSFWLSICFCQKKEFYANDALNYISKLEFEKNFDPAKHFDLRFELDTLIINVRVLRIKKGKISKTKLNSIKSNIYKLGEASDSRNDILVINYYHGLDRCNSTGNASYIKAKYKRFLKEINKIKNIKQFFVYKSPEGTKKYGSNLNWIHDDSMIIEKTFFPIQYPCGSYVMIDRNGNYYSNKGEYDIDRIKGLIKRKRTFNGKQ